MMNDMHCAQDLIPITYILDARKTTYDFLGETS